MITILKCTLTHLVSYYIIKKEVCVLLTMSIVNTTKKRYDVRFSLDMCVCGVKKKGEIFIFYRVFFMCFFLRGTVSWDSIDDDLFLLTARVMASIGSPCASSSADCSILTSI